MLVSVIIPIYNVEKYLEKCLDTVINQTYYKLEIILINDGSTDNSLNICKQIKKKDNRVKIINNNNKGLMSSWIDGVNIAKGEYTIFVDSDDWIDYDLIENLTNLNLEKKYDLIVSNYSEVYAEGIKRYELTALEGEYDKKKIEDEIYPYLLNTGQYFGRIIPLCRWAKLIKTKLLKNNIKYCNTKISYGEDINIMIPTILDCQKILISSVTGYYYNRMNVDSIMVNYKKNMYDQVSLLNEALLKISNEKTNNYLNKQISDNYICLLIATIRNEFNSNNFEKKVKEMVIDSKNKGLIKNHTMRDLTFINKLLISYIEKEHSYKLKLVYILLRLKGMM